jgi:hypothetical protein
MAHLPKYHLVHYRAKDDWALRNEQGRTVRRYETKGEGIGRPNCSPHHPNQYACTDTGVAPTVIRSLIAIASVSCAIWS